MPYIIDEIQTNNGQTSVLRTICQTEAEAESVYHAVLSAAAISSVEIHAAVMFSHTGNFIQSKCYPHGNENAEK